MQPSLAALCWDVWTVRSLADHRMMDRSRENVDDARHIKLDSIIPNKNYIKHDDTPLQLQMTLAALIMGWDQEVRGPDHGLAAVFAWSVEVTP